MTRTDRRAVELRNHESRVSNKVTVRILNPAPGGKVRLKYENAERHVKGKSAVWVDLRNERCIEFVGHRHESAMKNIRENIEMDKAVASGIATLKQMRALPLINPSEMMAPSVRSNWGWRAATSTAERRAKVRPQAE